MTTYTRKIGQNRGKPRLWLEGVILSEHGFPHGTRWIIAKQPPFLLLLADPNGDRKVAGTQERPIIDINSAKLLAGLDPVVEITELRLGQLQVRNAK